jgi:hypothetical protein
MAKALLFREKNFFSIDYGENTDINKNSDEVTGAAPCCLRARAPAPFFGFTLGSGHNLF